MKKRIFFLAFLVTASFFSVFVNGQQLAFPGAEGFGRFAKGARGVSAPVVYHVTHLGDSGEGSFRDAISKPGRIVVFDVSGVINIKDRLVFSGNSYIAGQTAPGDGVIIYGNGVSFSGANNLIVRHLRIYMGKGGSSGKDASGIANGSNMIFDHLSIAWGLDENFSVSWDSKGTEPEDITIQNSIIGQGLMSHSAGGLIQTDGGVSIIGCLYIDNKTRNAKVKGLNQFINNVVYNWNGSNGYILGDSGGKSWVQKEGNYFICGPNSSRPFERANANFQIYQKNNLIDTNKDGVLNGVLAQNSNYGSATFVNSLSDFANISIPKPHPDIIGGILSPDDALNKVIASVGASLPARTHVDEYLIDELLSYGTKGRLIAHEKENNIPGILGVNPSNQAAKPLDSDDDGIPDWWVEQHNLRNDPNFGATKINPATGYLYIEEYLNGIETPVAPYVRSAWYLEMTDCTLTSIDLKWKNYASESDRIVIEKSFDGINFTPAGTVAGDATAYTVTNLEEDTTYYFRIVTQKDDLGTYSSAYSEPIEAYTKGNPKAPYQSHTPYPEQGKESRFYTQIDFTWDNSTRPWGGDVVYDVYFGNSPDSLTKVATDINNKALVHANAGMEMNKKYYWRVDATNNEGTTTGNIWDFTTSEYSFEATYVDIGTDYNGNNDANGTLIPAVSEVRLAAGTKSYTVNDEMKFSVSGGNTVTGDGSYWGKGAAKITYFDLTAANHYIEGILTDNSKNKNIVSVKINGTSSSTGEETGGGIVFCNKNTFDANSVIGAEEFTLAEVRKGNSGTIITAPVGSKSFRIYRQVTITPTGEVSPAGDDLYKISTSATSNSTTLGLGSNNRIPYVGVNLELLSCDGEECREIDTNNTISEATINNTSATVNQSAGTITCRLPFGTVLGEMLVTFTLGSAKATANFTSGNMHNFANGQLLIEVTAENGAKKVYTVSITVATGKTIGILTANGKAESYDDLFMSAFAGYDVEHLTAAATAPDDINEFYSNCDLIVVHANVAGDNATLGATRNLVGVKPVLNMKVFCYTNSRWSWSPSGSNPSNTSVGTISSTVSANLQNHNIFKDVTFTGETLTFYSEPTNVQNGIQYTSAFGGTNWTSDINGANHVLATVNNTGTHIHEINLDNAAKYIMLGLSHEGEPSSYTLFNDNTVTILKNTVAYLLNPNAYYNYETGQPSAAQNITTNGITYFGDWIKNPEQKNIMIFNSIGIPVLTSKDSHISVRQLPAGIYIIKAKSEILKFVKQSL